MKICTNVDWTPPRRGNFFSSVNIAFGPVSRGPEKGYTVSTARCRRSFETARAESTRLATQAMKNRRNVHWNPPVVLPG